MESKKEIEIKKKLEKAEESGEKSKEESNAVIPKSDLAEKLFMSDEEQNDKTKKKKEEGNPGEDTLQDLKALE
eukprot:3860820-Karenia_brevis.AAC.1